MNKTTRFYFRLEKETGASKDGKSPVYCIQTLEHQNEIDYKKFSNIFRKQLASSGGCSVEYVTPLTKEQYEEEMEVDGP